MECNRLNFDITCLPVLFQLESMMNDEHVFEQLRLQNQSDRENALYLRLVNPQEHPKRIK